MQIDSSLGTTLPLTELGLLIEVACNKPLLAEFFSTLLEEH